MLVTDLNELTYEELIAVTRELGVECFVSNGKIETIKNPSLIKQRERVVDE